MDSYIETSPIFQSWERELASVNDLETVDFPALAPLLLALADLRNLSGEEEGIKPLQKVAQRIAETDLLNTIVTLSGLAVSPTCSFFPTGENDDEHLLWVILGAICAISECHEAAYSYYLKSIRIISGKSGYGDREVLALQLGVVNALAYVGKREESLAWLSGLQQDYEAGLWIEEENMRMIQECREQVMGICNSV